MCSILGAIAYGVGYNYGRKERFNSSLNWLMRTSHVRGRDGRGYVIFDETPIHSGYKSVETSNDWEDKEILIGEPERVTFIGNTRAEPTTEYVARKSNDDQQPYTLGPWSIVHNGTIANDKELRTGLLRTKIDSAAIAEQLYKASPTSSKLLPPMPAFEIFLNVVKSLKGSFAILATHNDCPGVIFTAANYRPIWYAESGDHNSAFFASSRNFFPFGMTPKMLEPYTAHMFAMGAFGRILEERRSIRQTRPYNRALVVCSGGLDSVVAATAAKAEYDEVELIHFMYGSRAEVCEIIAVQKVADYLGVKVTLFPLPVYKPGDSPLLDAHAKVAGGEAGAEFAHEWVPARNLLLLSVATAFAEANKFDVIVLGNNLEEAGAYPDNEPEFVHRFNDILPFAVGDGVRMEVIMPVGNLMKHEIVKYGKEINAPMHLTWSCYRNGRIHCGTCGPCYMRRQAFYINKLPEVITYANGNEGNF